MIEFVAASDDLPSLSTTTTTEKCLTGDRFAQSVCAARQKSVSDGGRLCFLVDENRRRRMLATIYIMLPVF